MMLVSLEAAKDHLRVDSDDEDRDLTLKVAGASAAVLRYLKSDGIADFADSSGELMLDSSGVAEGVPFEVQAATLLMVGYIYRLRDTNDNTAIGLGFEQGYLPAPVTALLYGRRDPACA